MAPSRLVLDQSLIFKTDDRPPYPLGSIETHKALCMTMGSYAIFLYIPGTLFSRFLVLCSDHIRELSIYPHNTRRTIRLLTYEAIRHETSPHPLISLK